MIAVFLCFGGEFANETNLYLLLIQFSTVVQSHHFHTMFPHEEWQTPQQWSLCQWRYMGLTYRQLRQVAEQNGIHLCNDESLSSCFRKTALGLTWAPQDTGGADPYLCPQDARTLVHEIVNGAESLDSCPTDFVLNRAHELKMQRANSAVCILHQLRCPELAARIDLAPFPPSKQWLLQFCAQNNLRIKCCEKLDAIRRRCCDRGRISAWFQAYGEILQQYPPEMIVNMDESGISTNRRFKVVIPDGYFPVTPECRREIHITGICTFSATGKLFRPGIILPAMRSLPTELMGFTGDCDIYTSKAGWMTKSVFELWSMNFAHEVHQWRNELPLHLRDKRVLLIVDGHSSRKTAKGILYLQRFGIDVLTLPGHCTHIIQPYDVGIAAQMKGQLLKEVRRCEYEIRMGRLTAPSQVGLRRLVLVRSFIEAIRKTVTPMSSRTAFRICGICPVAPEVPLRSHLLLDNVPGILDHPSDWTNSFYFSFLSQAVQYLCWINGLSFIPTVSPADILVFHRGLMLTAPRPLLLGGVFIYF